MPFKVSQVKIVEGNPEKGKSKMVIEDVLSYMRSQVGESVRIEDIAAYFHYSKYHFSREFKRLTGVSPREFMMALKIERSIEKMLKQTQPILRIQLGAGYLSSGTFSTTFSNNTGASPRVYKQGIKAFFKQAKAYESNQSSQRLALYQQSYSANEIGHTCQFSISAPREFTSGLIFVGLFKRPIPNHRPVVGVALRSPCTYKFTKIPEGEYFLMTVAIKKSQNPLDYFLLNQSLRAQHSEAVIVPNDHSATIPLVLREALAEDPPIIFNFLKLLKEVLLKFE